MASLPAPATTMSIPADATFEQWIEAGRHLAGMKRDLGFMIGDWVNHGREHFAEQFEMALEQAGIDERFAIKAASVAKTFPPQVRARGLSFDHHRAVMKLPRAEQLDLLKQADRNHWRPRELKDAVVQLRYDKGDDFADEDVDSYLLSQVVRAWNRATEKARADFLTLANLAELQIIDEDFAYAEPEG